MPQPQEPLVKTCVTCRHYIPPAPRVARSLFSFTSVAGDPLEARCAIAPSMDPEARLRHAVTGQVPNPARCIDERRYHYRTPYGVPVAGAKRACGPDGDNWQSLHSSCC